jgi:hypothetical protein
VLAPEEQQRKLELELKLLREHVNAADAERLADLADRWAHLDHANANANANNANACLADAMDIEDGVVAPS